MRRIEQLFNTRFYKERQTSPTPKPEMPTTQTTDPIAAEATTEEQSTTKARVIEIPHPTSKTDFGEGWGVKSVIRLNTGRDDEPNIKRSNILESDDDGIFVTPRTTSSTTTPSWKSSITDVTTKPTISLESSTEQIITSTVPTKPEKSLNLQAEIKKAVRATLCELLRSQSLSFCTGMGSNPEPSLRDPRENNRTPKQRLHFPFHGRNYYRHQYQPQFQYYHEDYVHPNRYRYDLPRARRRIVDYSVYENTKLRNDEFEGGIESSGVFEYGNLGANPSAPHESYQ